MQTVVRETISGTLSITWIDRTDGASESPLFQILDNTGRSIRLAFSDAQALGVAQTAGGRSVSVTGQWATPSTAFDVQSLSVDDPAGVHATAGLGFNVPFVTVLCRFSDAASVTPRPLSFYEALSGSGFPSFDHYFREVSEEYITQTGNSAAGWFNLPQPASYYGSSSSVNLSALAGDCAAAADASVNFTQFAGINFVFNGPIGAGASGIGTTAQQLTIDGQSRNYRMTFTANGSNSWLFFHEMGHTFGLLHSSGPYASAYDSHWTPMSGCCGRLSDPLGNSLPAHFLAWEKMSLGWPGSDRKVTVTSLGAQTVTLERHAMPAPGTGIRLVIIPFANDPNRFYTVESRQAVGYDASAPAEAVVIHDVLPTRADRRAQVVDPDGNGDPNDAGATWVPGETFTDAANGVAVRIDGKTSTGFTVTITKTAVPCSFALGTSLAKLPTGGGTGSVQVTTRTDCAWTAVSDASFVTITGGASGTGNGSVSYSVAPNTGTSQRVGTLTVAGQVFSIYQTGNGPTVTIDPPALQFAATIKGAAFVAQTTSQKLRISQTGSGTVTWTATSVPSWMTVSPASGTGPATLTVSVVFQSTLPVNTSINGSFTLTFTGAGNMSGPIGMSVTLKTVQDGLGAGSGGVFETPINNSQGVTGSIPVTGWALDDIEVRNVRILRDPVAGEGSALIFIGNAVLVEGSRPDVAAQYPMLPRNTRAGWGYLMLTNFLPNQGNGTFKLYAYVDDAEGHSTLLGTKTITCTNSSATKPFGAIDTPGQGEVVSGANYANFGWVLAPGTTRADPPSGGTVTAYIDGAPIGTPGAWGSRPDLTMLFPAGAYSGVANALGVLGINTTLLANGVHTIYWVVTATNGQTDGIGSRFFTVTNGASLAGSTLAGSATVIERQAGSSSLTIEGPGGVTLQADDLEALPRDLGPLPGRRGFDPARPLQSYAPGPDGTTTIHGEELDRFEVHVGAGTTGYHRTGQTLAPLPVGSHLDPATGVFTWQPGVGFVHGYDLVFVHADTGRATRRDVRIVLHPKGSNRVGPQVTIDAPASARATAGTPVDVAQPFVVAGWAIDPDDGVGTGADAVHVWAYPVGGGEPVFLGAAAYGGQRPDVGAIFGERFTASGYGLLVNDLAPGAYDVAVFAWSTAMGRFAPAAVSRIAVK
jgi:M6 family metalloprotease-like protein